LYPGKRAYAYPNNTISDQFHEIDFRMIRYILKRNLFVTLLDLENISPFITTSHTDTLNYTDTRIT